MVGAELHKVYNRSYKHYDLKLAKHFLVGKIYRFYWRVFGGFKWGHGPLTIIGKVNHTTGNCEYPNTPYYRLTKAYKFLI